MHTSTAPPLVRDIPIMLSRLACDDAKLDCATADPLAANLEDPVGR